MLMAHPDDEKTDLLVLAVLKQVLHLSDTKRTGMQENDPTVKAGTVRS